MLLGKVLQPILLQHSRGDYMGFLYINGNEIDIKVSPSPDHSIVPIGSSGRTADGSLNGTKLRNVRQWKFTTGYQTQAEMMALRGVLSGDGNVWSFNDTLYCGKGLTSTFARASTAYKTDGTSVLSGAVRYENGPLNSTFSIDKSISIYEGVTNLLTANQASVETNTTGFTALLGATIARSTAQFWTGAASLEVITPGVATAEGVIVNATAVSAATNYNGLIRIKGAIGATLQFQLTDNVDKATSYNFTCDGTWQEINATHLTDAHTTLQLRIATQGTIQSTTFYVDGLQLAAKSYNVGFQLPGTTRANEVLYLTTPQTNIAEFDGLTIGAWINVNDATKYQKGVIGFNGILTIMRTDNVNFAIVLAHSSLAAEWRFNTYDDTGASPTINGVVDSLTPNGWHFFAATIDYYNGVSRLYIDGVLQGTATSILKPTVIGTKIYVGCGDGTSSFLNSQIDNVMFFPYRWTDEMISGFYGLGRPLRTPPFFEAYGDEVGRSSSNPLICNGQIDKIEVKSFGATRQYLTSFTIVEA